MTQAAGARQPGKSVASSTLFTHESPEAIIAAMDTAKNRLTELKVKQTLESTRPGDHPDDHHGDDGESAPLPEPGVRWFAHTPNSQPPTPTPTQTPNPTPNPTTIRSTPPVCAAGLVACLRRITKKNPKKTMIFPTC